MQLTEQTHRLMGNTEPMRAYWKSSHPHTSFHLQVRPGAQAFPGGVWKPWWQTSWTGKVLTPDFRQMLTCVVLPSKECQRRIPWLEYRVHLYTWSDFRNAHVAYRNTRNLCALSESALAHMSCPVSMLANAVGTRLLYTPPRAIRWLLIKCLLCTIHCNRLNNTKNSCVAGKIWKIMNVNFVASSLIKRIINTNIPIANTACSGRIHNIVLHLTPTTSRLKQSVYGG